MRHFFRVSEVWHDPAPRLEQAAALIAVVVLLEATAFAVRKGWGLDPFLVLGTARGMEGILLLILGPWSLRSPDRRAAAGKSLKSALAIAGCGLAFLGIWKGLVPFPPPGMPGRIHPPAAGWGVFLFTTCIASPVAEELVFRGLLYRGLRLRCSFPMDMVLVSLGFAGLHVLFGGPFLVPLAGSMLFCAVYEKEKIFVAPVLLHVLGNGILFLSPFMF